MSETERARVIEAAFAQSPDAAANYLTVLDAQLRVFEQRYELPTAELREALAAGRLRDTADVSKWLFWAGLRTDLVAQTRP